MNARGEVLPFDVVSSKGIKKCRSIAFWVAENTLMAMMWVTKDREKNLERPNSHSSPHWTASLSSVRPV